MNSPAKGNYAEINGINLYYEVQGEGDPLILLHGGLVSLESFGEVSVAPPEELSVNETIGSSYVLLSVTASSLASPGPRTLTVELRSGSSTS